MADEHRMHNGPLRGEHIPTERMDSRILHAGEWRLRLGRFQGRYIRDQGSAGGRDWDWEED